MPPATKPDVKAQLVEHPRRAQALAARPLPISGFGGGTLIITDDGPVPVEWLRPGDKVLTYHNGFQTVRWIGRDCLKQAPETIPAVHLPMRVAEGTRKPRNTMLAARHRVVLSGWQIELYFGLDAIFAEAGMLCDAPCAFPALTPGANSCTHLLFDAPQIVQANGAWVESMQLSTGTIACLSDEAAELIDRLELDLATHVQPALSALYPWEAQHLQLDLADLLACDPAEVSPD